MNINNNCITFKAKFVNKANIGRVVKGCYPIYERQGVSFIKINPSNSGDIKALEETAKYWIYGSYAENIYHAAKELSNKNKAYKNHSIYALTAQRSNFDKLNSDELLGLVHTCPSEDGFTSIEYLQVNPYYVYDTAPAYKGVGSGILDSLKLLYNKLSCHPATNKSVIKFYEKNGFIKQTDKLNCYTYCK